VTTALYSLIAASLRSSWVHFGPVTVLEDDGWSTVSHWADLLTIAAALIAFVGVLSTVLSMPRLSFVTNYASPDLASLSVFHSKGSSVARNISIGIEFLEADGKARSGDGRIGGDNRELMLGSSIWIQVHDRSVTMSPTVSTSELRIELDKPRGFLLTVTWQRPLLPWMRARRIFRWTQAERAAGTKPVLLAGLAARRAVKAARES
jgi:hypothetical protein